MYYNGGEIKNLLHEVMVTREILPFWERTLRGRKTDEVLKPDFEIVYCDTRICGEMDLDTEGYGQVKEQMQKYEDAGVWNVWFAPTDTRLQGITKLATQTSVFSRCGSNLWVDVYGKQLRTEQLTDTRTE